MRNVQSGDVSGMTATEIEDAKRYLDDFNMALKRGVPYDGVVYRGLYDVRYEDINQWLENGEIQLNNHQSATVIEKTASEFATNYGYGDKQSVLLEIDQNSGISLYEQTQVTSGYNPIEEQEVVLLKDTIYKVISHEYIKQSGTVMDWDWYFEGSEYSYPNNVPIGWYPGKDISGYWKIKIKEING